VTMKMKALHVRLESIGIPSEWVTGRGGHSWAYWSSILQQMLKFHIGVEQGIDSLQRQPLPAAQSAPQ
jgi:enterochelin esterase-like enzyme